MFYSVKISSKQDICIEKSALGIRFFSSLYEAHAAYRLACNLGYYGLLIGIGDLVGDIYVNNIVGGVTEIVAYSLCFLILRGGRKLIYVIFMLVGGLGLISAAVVGLCLPGNI